MRTILFLIGLFIININILVGQTNKILDFKNATTIEEIRKVRFTIIPREEYSLDTDRYIIGQQNVLDNQKRIDRDRYINRIKKDKQQNLKLKKIYLDFVIIQEENIS
jgi:hypothetical protein